MRSFYIIFNLRNIIIKFKPIMSEIKRCLNCNVTFHLLLICILIPYDIFFKIRRFNVVLKIMQFANLLTFLSIKKMKSQSSNRLVNNTQTRKIVYKTKTRAI